jgi:predicted dehydrogenase
MQTRRAAQWDVPAYDSLDDVLGDESVDAVLVLTPVELHEPVAQRALTAGKHVFVEKPVGSAAECRSLSATAERLGLVCMPGHNYAYQPEFQTVRRLVHSGDLGVSRAAWITYVIQHPESVAARYDGVLDEVMVHHAYLALALFGEPRAVWAGRAETGWANHDVEDQAWMTLEYPGGLSVHAFATFAVDDDTSDPWMFVVKVLGTRGSATYNWRDAVFRRPLGTLSIAVPAYEDSYLHEHAAFAAAIRGDAAAIVSPLSDAVGAELLLAAARTSDEQGIRVRLGHGLEMIRS